MVQGAEMRCHADFCLDLTSSVYQVVCVYISLDCRSNLIILFSYYADVRSVARKAGHCIFALALVH